MTRIKKIKPNNVKHYMCLCKVEKPTDSGQYLAEFWLGDKSGGWFDVLDFESGNRYLSCTIAPFRRVPMRSIRGLWRLPSVGDHRDL